ncbi:MAG: hypothetical protein QM831_05125 [Kofleriaceae bacterium]
METFVPAARLPRRRLSRTTQKALDRLSRRAHRFHRFAHHPLCEQYAGEVVRIGKTRLCRGCTFAVVGGAVGGAAGLVVGGDVRLAIAAVGVGGFLLLATLYSKPGASDVGKRHSKWITRLIPAALFAFAMTTSMLTFRTAGFALAGGAAAIVGGLRLLYGRRGADRSPCTACPERTQSPCSGFRAIVQRERAVQRVARSIISP